MSRAPPPRVAPAARAMNLAAIFAVSSAALAMYVAILTGRISAAPGARDHRGFSVVALSSAAYALCDLLAMIYDAPWLVVTLSRVQTLAAMLQLWGWVRYSHAFTDAPWSRVERVAARGLVVAGSAVLVPGLVFTGTTTTYALPAAAEVVRQGDLTALGVLLMASLVGGMIPILVRFARAWRAGVRHAGLLTLAFAALLACGANDALCISGAYEGYYLLAPGFALPVVAVGWVITGRFVASSRALHRLSGELEATVEARTRELATALDALHRAEKLAAVGQFASGVAHEVNNPAAAVTTSLRYLIEACEGRGGPPEDAHEVACEALASMQRINELVRKLVDAGRIASIPGALAPVALAEVIAAAVGPARGRAGPRVAIAVDAPPHLHVRARRESLQEVLENLLANAIAAIPPERPGRIAVRAEETAGGVRVSVADDGVGMGPEVLRCAFDPFFTTNPSGQGVGLGLAVAKALVESHSGAIRLESAPGAGTTAIVELPQTPTGYLPLAPAA